MSNETTGATPEQIKAAQHRMRVAYGFRHDHPVETGMVYYAIALVPPDHRIIGPELVAVPRSLVDALAAARRERLLSADLMLAYDDWAELSGDGENPVNIGAKEQPT